LTLTGAPDAFISFERAIAVQNVADLEPPRWLTSLLATHPPTAERIASAVSFAGQVGSASPAPNGHGRAGYSDGGSSSS
jgi:STE24 endopeptidase